MLRGNVAVFRKCRSAQRVWEKEERKAREGDLPASERRRTACNNNRGELTFSPSSSTVKFQIETREARTRLPRRTSCATDGVQTAFPSQYDPPLPPARPSSLACLTRLDLWGDRPRPTASVQAMLGCLLFQTSRRRGGGNVR